MPTDETLYEFTNRLSANNHGVTPCNLPEAIMTAIQTKLDYADAVADWFLELGESHCRRGDFEVGLKYVQVAAAILTRQSRKLSSSRIEAIFQFVANHVGKNEMRDEQEIPIEPVVRKPVFLHVLDEALPAGGLTAMALRWIKNDRSGRIHSVALLSQHVNVPEALIQAVQAAGGKIYKASPDDSFLTRAAWLRKLANDLASCVILHIGVTDVIAGIAFGKKGGPPVIIVNHAAHIFWTGASIADLVVNCRGSALEKQWTEFHRDVRSATIPIPLLEIDSSTSVRDATAILELKCQAKRKLGLPENSVVILTVGAAFKYTPVDDLDFLAVVEDILWKLPEAILLVVGFNADARWSQVSKSVGLRIKTFGVVPQTELSKIHEASDVYIEGFPFGSTTALLEAGMMGIPVVLGPAQCPPPYSTDGVAFDDILQRPCSVENFKGEVIRLCGSQNERISFGNKIRTSVIQHHTGDGWREYMEAAIQKLPLEHVVNDSINPIITPEVVHNHWCKFVEKTDSAIAETLEHSVTRSLLMGLRPRLTSEMIGACKKYKPIRAGRTIPLPILFLLCNIVLSVVPIGVAEKVFRGVSFLFRKSLLKRIRTRNIFGGHKPSRSWYEDYRKVRSS